MTAPLIRFATPEDASTITEFNAAMARETEHIELDLDRLRAGVDNLIADPARGFYLVAELDTRLAGQLMITYEWSDWRNATFWWIQSVYIHPDFRRQGIFRSLYADITRRARADPGVCGIRLYVERENHRAQAAYAALGMRHAGYEMFEVDFVLRRSA